jgi:hypothetical protein
MPSVKDVEAGAAGENIASGTVEIDLLSLRDGIGIFCDGTEIQRCGNPRQVAPALDGIIVDKVLERIGSFLRIRAGFARVAGKNVVVTGPRGSGKTALLMELMARGEEIRCDRVVLIKDKFVVPFPRRFLVREVTLTPFPELEEHCKGLDRHRLEYGGSGFFFDPLAAGMPWNLAGGQPDFVFHLEPNRGGAAAVRQDGGVEMVKKLFLLANIQGAKAEHLRNLAKLVSSCRCYSLAAGDPWEAAEIISRACTDPAWEPPPHAHGLPQAAPEEALAAIRTTKPLSLPKTSFPIHMLTCHKDLDMALWCLKSFMYFSECCPEITIHDDGSLTQDDVELLREQLPGCEVIPREEADRRVGDALRKYPLCRKMRPAPGFHCALKVFDPWVYSSHDAIVVMDSDILFFRRPEQLLEYAEQGRACFSSDYQNAYSVEIGEMKSRLGIEVFERINAGLFVLCRKDHDLDVLEGYFEAYPETDGHQIWLEQTLHALLLSRAGAQRLDPAYQISGQAIGAATVSHHFVTDGSRELFAARGLEVLRRRGFPPPPPLPSGERAG